MKFKSNAFPKPCLGQKEFGPVLVVPNQAMSLEEILERFTRGEPVAVGRDISYHESDDDLEKVSKMDLVDRDEYIEKLKQTQKDFDKQEKRKAAKEREKLVKEAAEKLAAEKQKASQADPSKVSP